MVHRFDLHVHSFFSSDAASAPEELIEAARARGLSGIAITDHDTCDVHEYLIENGLERADGLPAHGFLVVPGVEVSTAEGHLLCIGTLLPDMRGQPAAEVFGRSRTAAAWRFPPIPTITGAPEFPRMFSTRSTSRRLKFSTPPQERISMNRHWRMRRGGDLSMTASSDAHHASAVAVSFTHFDLEELNLADLLRAIRKGGTPEGHYLSMREAMKKQFGALLRPANRKPSLKAGLQTGSRLLSERNAFFPCAPCRRFPLPGRLFELQEEAAGRPPTVAEVSPTPTPAATPEPVDLNSEVIVLCYHRFEDRPKDSLAIKPSEFETQLQVLKDNGITVIPMADFLAWRRGEKSIPPKSAIISIDDGYISGYSVAWPILKKFGYPFTMFIYTDYVKGGAKSGGQSISWQQLAEMRDAGVDIQSHTVTHSALNARKGKERRAICSLAKE